MNDKPKDPKDGPSGASGAEDAIDAEWDEAPAADPETTEADDAAAKTEDDADAAEAKAEDAEAAEENASDADAAEETDEAKDDAEALDAAEAAAAAAAVATGAAAAASVSSAEPAAEPEKRGGGLTALLVVWMLLLTAGLAYLFYAAGDDGNLLPQQIAAVETRVGKVETTAGAAQTDAKAAQGKADANAAAIEALQAADADLKAADVGQTDSAKSLADQLAAIGPALAGLKASIAQVAETAGSVQPDDGAKGDAAANADAIKALAGDVGGKVDTLSSAVLDMQTRLAALEERAERASGRSLAAAVLALNDLRAGVASGKPFGKLLGRAQAALPDAAALKDSPWTGFADKGLPTDDALLADMQGLSVAIGQDKLKDRLSSGENWLDRAVGGVVDRLKVRRVGAGVEGESPAAVAARAEAALLDGDLPKAIAEVESLEGDEAARFKAWLDAAKAAVAAETDIDAVEQAAIAAADGA